MSSQSSSTPGPRWIHDVFLSFSGDIHATFTSGLYNSLTYGGVSVFMGDEELPRGDKISLSVIQAIQVSRISVIVFTKNYVESTWCLQELEEIMECSRTRGQRVVPVFYDLDPVDVRNQRGEFGEAFENLMERVSEDKVKVWRAALQEATNISGFDLHNSRNTSEDINEIVENINCLLDDTVLFVIRHPIGVQSHVQSLLKLLNSRQSKNVQLLGIWGMGGSGKTTIAQAIYNRIHRHFEGCCFLPNIWKCCQRSSTGLAHLQEQFLSDIFKTQNTESERSKLQQRLRHKRILLILDDVSSIEQLEASCPSAEWFGPGSIIIITTRDRHILSGRVDYVYEMKLLNMEESLELLSWHAFKQASPKREDFLDVTGRVVKYCGGLPLALKVVGSLLFDMTLDGWVSVLEDLQRAPYRDVIYLLRICFDRLNDENEKKIFFEICCFFVGMDKNDVIQILNGYGLLAEIGIRILVDRNLVTVDNGNRLGMHDVLEEMGRHYIHQSGSWGKPKIYDVFLSFRGEDTRASFISHLYASLQNAGIYTFRDDDEIQRGDDVSISLMQAINMSRICVVVLSRNYASSRWCLQELEHIMESRSVVVPVFYGVDPSQVRNQSDLFGQAFKDLKKRVRVNESKELRWREALLEVGSIAGFVVLESRNENEDIMKIVEHITRLLDWKDLFVANHPVGIESRVQDVLKLLKNQQSENPILLGMWGMGGIGKTTIAKAAYNKIRREFNFEGRCFLLNIREVWEQDNGGVRLQKQLLFDIYKTMKEKIQNIEHGKSILEKRLSQKRILLVLDDVDKLEQLNALAGSRKWFSPKSVVIITARDAHLLTLLDVEVLYKIEVMNDTESVELFSWHAFKEPCPTKEFDEISKEVISCCGKLPLALEVIGSHLFKRGFEEWRSVLDNLKSIPDKQVQKKLQISFDGLSDDKKREIFLDIAFFFIGMERNDVIDILKGCGHSPENGIKVLEERSLITVDAKNKLRMHDLLRDMGREIIRERSPNMPEERSRLWDPKEVHNVLSKNMGTKAVEGLALMLPRMNSICLKTKAFKNMKRLRLLQLAGVQLEGDFKYLSTDLRWLCWHGCPSTYTNADFDQRNLVAIDLKYSTLQLVWKKGQLLDSMKILNLSHSQHLTQTPNFKYLPNLEKLILKDCSNLSSVSHTIGRLKHLLLINLKGCASLRALPRSIYKLKSLKTLILSGCLMIDKLEEDLEQMESLATLMADDTAITQVPYALMRLKSIGYISMCGFEGLSRNVIPSIFWSWTSPTNNLSPKLQASVDLSGLFSLTGPNSSSHGTSSIINEFPRVQSLMLGCGSQLQITGDAALDNFNASNGMQLEAAPTTSHVLTMGETSTLVDCYNQGDLSGSKSCLNSILVQMGINCPVTKILRESISQKLTRSGSVLGDCLLPGDKNPDWLAFNCEGFSVIIDVPQVNGRNLKTVMLCIVYSSSPNIITPEGLILKNVLIINHTKATTDVYEGDSLTSLRDEDWQSIISNLEPGDKVQVVVVLGHGFIVKKTAVYLIYEEQSDQKMELFHADVFVSCGNNIVSGGGYGVVANMNENAFGVDDMATDMNENTPSVDDVVADGDVVVFDMLADNNNNNNMVSGRDENRFGRFFKLPYLVRAVLKTRPCWLGLLVILVWITYRRSNKRRKLNRIARYILKWKWLVEPINKLIAHKKANKAQGAIECNSKML